MNHCIPDRRLQPHNAQVYQGLVVTEPLGGHVEHYVLLNQQCTLFAMPAQLFECNERNVKNTRRLRLEKLLEFGDSIIFTCDFNRHVVLDYEKACKVDETMCQNGKFLVRTLCILSPSVKDSCIWTNIFGKFVMNTEEISMVRQQIISDVPVYAWFEICIVDHDGLPTMRPKLYKIVDDEGVSTVDRTIVWDTDWRRGTQQLHLSDDDDSDLDEYIEKPEDELYQLKVGLQGVVINDFEIFSPSYRDERIFMGCWRIDDVKRRPLGSRIFFDMMLSDVAGWVVYYYTRNGGVFSADDAEPPLYAVEKIDINAERRFGSEPDYRTYISINVRIMDFNLGGFYSHEYFGLVTDGLQLLRCLPYACEELKQVCVDVVDIGPGHMARFEIAKLPLYISELVEEAEEKMRNEEIYAEGFLLNNQTGQLYAYKYPNVHFFFNEEKVHLATGTWCEFWAHYVSDATFIIVRHKVIYDGPPLDCGRVDGPSEGPIKYEFKIPVEYHKSYKKLLFNRYCGFVADPNNKFKPPLQFKRADVIVEQDTAREATTLFKVKRMAKKNEGLSKVKIGLIVEVDDAATSSSSGTKKSNTRKSAADVDDDDELDFGLPMGSVCDPAEDEDDEAETAYVEERQLSNVEFNSKYSIRERKLMARQRKWMRERQSAQNERAARLNTSGKN